MASTRDNFLTLMTIVAIAFGAATLAYGENVGLGYACGAGSFCSAPR